MFEILDDFPEDLNCKVDIIFCDTHRWLDTEYLEYTQQLSIMSTACKNSFNLLPTSHPTVVMSVQCKGFHSGDYGHHMGIHCNVACASIEIQIYLQPILSPGGYLPLNFCSLIKNSGYTVQY